MAEKKAKKVEEVVKETTAVEAEAVKAEPVDQEKPVVKEESAVEPEKKTTRKTAKKAATKTAEKTTKKVAEKTAAKKPVAKKTADKKTTATKTTNIYIQFNGKEVSQEELTQRIIDKWCEEEGKRASSVKELNIYIKPEDNCAYYVINGQGSSIEL